MIMNTSDGILERIIYRYFNQRNFSSSSTNTVMTTLQTGDAQAGREAAHSPPSGRLASRMTGDVRVMVHVVCGSLSEDTMMAASSTQRFSSYFSSVTV